MKNAVLAGIVAGSALIGSVALAGDKPVIMPIYWMDNDGPVMTTSVGGPRGIVQRGESAAMHGVPGATAARIEALASAVDGDDALRLLHGRLAAEAAARGLR